MIDKLKRYIAQSKRDSKKLQRKYRVFSLVFGFVNVIVGCTLVTYIMYLSRLYLGLPMGQGSLEGIRILFLTWILITITTIPIVFYLTMVVLGGSFGLVMVVMGKFTLKQAKQYALYGKFPQFWFASNA